jgi:ergothioneine biosynthesis protein EgtB
VPAPRAAEAPSPSRPRSHAPASTRERSAWVSFEERIALVGHAGEGFAFDNEGPAHRALVLPFGLGPRLVTNEEYSHFIEDRGYERSELWLAAGFAEVAAQGWTAPLYWERTPHGDWSVFTLAGMRPLDPAAPVAHVSFYEADAYARWAGARLPTEQEWEVAASGVPIEGNFVEGGLCEPAPPERGAPGLLQMFGDVWEWTASPYTAYPRFVPLAGALGEYNGKFMSGQMTLRGGSCFSPRSHLRLTYRNFFPPSTRWQMAGIRLAHDV